jgi:acyl-CoA hydrolase
MTTRLPTLDAAVETVLARIDGTIVLGTPLGIGKPNPFINALYRRIRQMPERRLRILTALSLQRPTGKSSIEKHFLEPFVERVFGDYPDLDYVLDCRAGRLPPNIDVQEFFFKTADYLGNAYAQQQHICTNFTFAARDMVIQGINVLAQAVAAREVGGRLRLSLSCNSDTSLEMIERLRATPGHRFITIAVINRELPFMPNYAEVDPEVFDYVVTDAAATHRLFGAPNMRVTLQDHAIGLHASSLVPDGGTIQIGIGSLGDAIANALIMRETRNDGYRAAIGTLTRGETAGRDTGRFARGLYGCSEMFVNGFMHLIEHGIVRRQVFADLALQTLLNEGAIGLKVDAGTLRELHRVGRIGSPLGEADVRYLLRFGILRPGVTLRHGQLWLDGESCDATISDEASLQALGARMLGPQLAGGIHMHGGFVLGPGDFYRKLREMPEAELAKIEMHCIEYINQTYGHGDIARAQRRDGRFINTTMMVTLLGAAVSDALDSGAVVSGVGGQYNFVAMAHALRDARSILLVRATRECGSAVQSNIVWNYGHVTIPRHLRDIVITEYGVADLRGRCDAEVIARLIAVADSRFQDELIDVAKRNHKLPDDFVLPQVHCDNTPEALEAGLQSARDAGLLPDFPFGTDFTPDELAMIEVLQRMKAAAEHPLDLVKSALRGLVRPEEPPPEWLERLGLSETHDLKTALTRRLFVGNL